MRVLLDTNIIIHREASIAVNEDVGVLFKWLDSLHHTKCVHPVSVEEIRGHGDPRVVKSMSIKLDSYHVLESNRGSRCTGRSSPPVQGVCHRQESSYL